MQPGKPETVQEKAIRLAQQAGAAYPEAVAAVLQPFEEPTAAGPSLFANLDGQIVPYEADLPRPATRIPRSARSFRVKANSMFAG